MLRASARADDLGPPATGVKVGDDPQIVNVRSKNSLVHLGSLDSFDVTDSGKQAAKLILDMLDHHHGDSARRAIQIYERIIPNENFGGEYTALEWICQYYLASDEDKQKMIADPVVASWYALLSADNNAQLRYYLLRKYHLQQIDDTTDNNVRDNLRFLEDFILFDNPQRERWEKTSKIIAALQVKPGYKIADVGSGPGYYTYKFSEMVGPTAQSTRSTTTTIT